MIQEGTWAGKYPDQAATPSLNPPSGFVIDKAGPAIYVFHNAKRTTEVSHEKSSQFGFTHSPPPVIIDICRERQESGQ